MIPFVKSFLKALQLLAKDTLPKNTISCWEDDRTSNHLRILNFRTHRATGINVA